MSQPSAPRRARRVRVAAITMAAALALAACSSGSDSTETAGAPTTVPAGRPATDAAAQVDPRTLSDPCAIFGEGTVERILGGAVEDPVPTVQSYEIGCRWSAQPDAFVTYTIDTERPGQEAFDGVMQYLEASQGTEEVDLGDRAVVKLVKGSSGTQAVLDSVIHGWYATITVTGTDDPRAQAIDLGRMLESSLVAFTPMDPSATSTTAGGSSGPAAPGTLTDLQVTIEEPAEIAGTTTLESLKVAGVPGYANCSQPGQPTFVLEFIALPGENPPTPVGTFTIKVDDGIDVGETAPASISVGLGRSDTATVTTYEGTLTVDAAGTGGTFEAPGGPKGTWSCVRAS